MQQDYSMLKEQNYQLKNQISELKNAFDLNRDILKIISEQSKSSEPRIQMLYQIINRLTSINNQIMINTAQLIHEKNTYKIQKQFLKRENQTLKQRIEQMVQKQQVLTKANKANELSVYFKNKISDLQNQLKVLEQERIIKEHEVQFLRKKLQYYQGEQKKISLIPTIDKNNPTKRFIEPPPSTLVQPLQHVRKHSTKRQIKLQIKFAISCRALSRLKIYTEQLQYRMLILLKALDIEEQIKKKDTLSLKKQHRKCLEESYASQMTQVRLLKFALNNLVKEEKQENDLMFTMTNRNFQKEKMTSSIDKQKCRRQYLYKSLQKDNRIKMKPSYNQTQLDQQGNQQ